MSQNYKLLRPGGSQYQTGGLGHRRSPLHKERGDWSPDDRRKAAALRQRGRIAEWLGENRIGHCLTGKAARRAA